MLNYVINHAVYFAHYDAYFYINDNAEKCRYFSVKYCSILSPNSFKLVPHEVLLDVRFSMDTLKNVSVSGVHFEIKPVVYCL